MQKMELSSDDVLEIVIDVSQNEIMTVLAGELKTSFDTGGWLSLALGISAGPFRLLTNTKFGLGFGGQFSFSSGSSTEPVRMVLESLSSQQKDLLRRYFLEDIMSDVGRDVEDVAGFQKLMEVSDSARKAVEDLLVRFVTEVMGRRIVST